MKIIKLAFSAKLVSNAARACFLLARHDIGRRQQKRRPSCRLGSHPAITTTCIALTLLMRS